MKALKATRIGRFFTWLGCILTGWIDTACFVRPLNLQKRIVKGRLRDPGKELSWLLLISDFEIGTDLFDFE